LVLLGLRLAHGAFFMAGMDIGYGPDYPQRCAILRTAGLPSAAEPAVGAALVSQTILHIERGIAAAILDMGDKCCDGAVAVVGMQA
jgi:hypothetical protein